MDLSVINVKDFEKITGKHLNFIERIAFKACQKKIRNNINTDGTITNNKLLKFLEGCPSKGFHSGGFLLGFFLQFIGVFIAYIIGGDKQVKRNRVKWAWIGLGAVLALMIPLILMLVLSLRFYWH